MNLVNKKKFIIERNRGVRGDLPPGLMSAHLKIIITKAKRLLPKHFSKKEERKIGKKKYIEKGYRKIKQIESGKFGGKII
jgi:hypothetical protein